jgi:pyrroline-5-carboxylate reductase
MKMSSITFIGGGNMASAIIGGLMRQDFDAKLLCAVEVIPELREQLSHRFGIRSFASAEQLPLVGEIVVLAVKPQQMRIALKPLMPKLHHQVVLSIAAGIRIADLSRWLGGYKRIIRCMPNTPALIGAGISAAYAAPAIARDECDAIEEVLKAIGKVIWVENETLLDSVTAVSGSGPAYVFYFIEALRDAARELGLSDGAANTLAIETFAGAAKLAAQDRDDVAILRERVTSQGGTTEAALKSMAQDHVKEAIIKGVKAANERSRELGVELGKD